MGVSLSFATPALSSVLFQDNFDGYSDSPINHGWKWVGDQVTNEASSGRNGSRGIRVRYNNNGFSGPHALTKDLKAYGVQEIFVRVYFKVGPNPTKGSKFVKFFGTASPPDDGAANTTFALKYESTELEEISYGDGATTQNDTQTIIKYSAESTNWAKDPLVVLNKQNGVFNPQDGGWHCFEAYMKYNSNDQRDGAYKVWIDGTLWVDASNVKNRHNLNGFFDYFNLGDYSAQPTTDWSLYYDDVVVSTSRIGLDGSTPPPSYSLNTSKNGTGAGTLTSSPSGINCGATCSYNFNENTTVTLTATPDSNSTFSAWTGCTSTNGNQCTVAIGTSNNAVAATFNTQAVTNAEFNWSQASYSAAEAGGTQVVGRILRTGDTTGTASVSWQTFGITANGADDYAGIYPTPVTFGPGETQKDVSLSILSDSLIEDNETLELRLSSPNNAALGALSSAVLTITEDVSMFDAGCLSDCDAGLADAHVADTNGIDVEVQDAGQTGDDVVWTDAVNDAAHLVDSAHADTGQAQTDAGIGSDNDSVAPDGVTGADTNDTEVIAPGCSCRSTGRGTSTQFFILLGLVLLWGRRRHI